MVVLLFLFHFGAGSSHTLIRRGYLLLLVSSQECKFYKEGWWGWAGGTLVYREAGCAEVLTISIGM